MCNQGLLHCARQVARFWRYYPSAGSAVVQTEIVGCFRLMDYLRMICTFLRCFLGHRGLMLLASVEAWVTLVRWKS